MLQYLFISLVLNTFKCSYAKHITGTFETVNDMTALMNDRIYAAHSDVHAFYIEKILYYDCIDKS